MRVRLTLLALAALPLGLGAQSRPVVKPARGTAAGIAPPPVQQVQPINPFAFGAVPGAVSFVTIPAIVTPDGRVYANFGFGYEQVVRNCGDNGALMVQSTTIAPVQPVVAQPTAGQQGYVAPAPIQTTPSVQQIQPQSQSVAASSCWRTDSRGQAFVVRP